MVCCAETVVMLFVAMIVVVLWVWVVKDVMIIVMVRACDVGEVAREGVSAWGGFGVHG